MLFNEPKLLKSLLRLVHRNEFVRFSALQRAEIAEIKIVFDRETKDYGFSALQRAEIAEMRVRRRSLCPTVVKVSVLFNEPKLLKWLRAGAPGQR